jgi:hypothetical protein
MTTRRARPGCSAIQSSSADVGTLGRQRLPEPLREFLVGAYVVDAPDDPVTVVLVEVVRGEVERDVGRIRPVEQTSGQAVVLAESEPVPVGVARNGVLHRIFPERTHQLALERCVYAEAEQSATEITGGVGIAAVRIARAKETELFVPGFCVEQVVELEPAFDAVFLQWGYSLRNSTMSWVGFPRAPSGSSARNANP